MYMKHEIKVVTYNLMCVWDHPKNIKGLTYRAGLVYAKIKKENPDIIGFQEVIAPQLEYLEHMFPEYLFIGQGRNADMMGEGLYIAIKKSVFMLCGMDVFWISPEPYVPATRFEEQSPYPRICVDILVRHKESGKMIRIYDVHLDHEESEAKAKGMKVVLDKISEICFFALIVCANVCSNYNISSRSNLHIFNLFCPCHIIIVHEQNTVFYFKVHGH
jgi:endonuclease/exonuclease/phosphatase family metal-dependent hydrolase